MLTVDPSNLAYMFKILFYSGSANYEMEMYKEAYEDLTEALKIRNDPVAMTMRAKIHFKLDEFEECIIDCEEAKQISNSAPQQLLQSQLIELHQVVDNLMTDAKQLLKARKPKSPFEILGVTKFSTVEEIKKSFRKLSLMYHSDKHPQATVTDKKKLERKFQELRHAYNILK